MRYRYLVPLFLLLPVIAFSQDILTAPRFFDSVSERYGEINDYVAEVAIQREEGDMVGTLYYRAPNLLRIDFSEPEEQVLVSDGENLMIYVPAYNVVLQQDLRGRWRSAETVASMAS